MTSSDVKKGWVDRYAWFTVRHRWLVLLSSLVVLLSAGLGLGRLRIENGYRYFFKPDNSSLVAYDKLQNVYTKTDNILFTVVPEGGDVFKAEVLEAVEELTESAWRLPNASRVDSVTNFQHSRGVDDELIVADLVRDARTLSKSELTAVRRIALAEPLLRDALVNPEGSVTGVNVNLILPDDDPAQKLASVAAARELAAKIKSAHPEIELRLTGNAMLNVAFHEAAMADMSTLTPLMYLVVLLVVGLFLRSVSGVVATLVVVAAATVMGLGWAGYGGFPLTSPSSAAITVIMTLAVADAVHLIVSAAQEHAGGASKEEAVVYSLKSNFGPVFLTSLTTAIGFLSMNQSEVRPFNDLGNMTALGVLAAFFLSVWTLPALLSVLPLTRRSPSGFLVPQLDALAGFVQRQRKGILVASAVVFVASSALVFQNRLDDRFVTYFDESTEFRKDTDFTMSELTGLYRLEFSLSAGSAGAISEPKYLEKLDEFAEWFRAQSRVSHVQSYTDVISRLNRNMHDEDPAYDRIPDSRELAAQYQLLFEMSLPYGLDMNDQVDIDRSATRFIVTVEDIPSAELLALGARGEKWLKDNAPAHMHAKAAGQAVMFAQMSGKNIRGMIFGTIGALLLISLTLMVSLRDLKLGALSMLPNLLPSLVCFGAWGLLDGEVNVALSAVAAISLGIVVDDTIHFVTRYLRARRELGIAASAAVRKALVSCGTALVVNSVVLICGFLVLSFSSFGLNAKMGLLTALVILVALLGDLVFLPALLIALGGETDTSDVASVENELTPNNSQGVPAE